VPLLSSGDLGLGHVIFVLVLVM